MLEAAHEGDRLFVALNLSDDPVTRTMPSAVARLAGDVSVTRGNEIAIPAHGWGILAPGG